MNANGLGLHRNLAAVACPHEAVLNHIQHLPGSLLYVMNQCIDVRARCQLAIRLIAPVGKHFAFT